MKRRSAEPIDYEPSTQAFLDKLGSTDPVDPKVDGVSAFRISARELQIANTCAVPDGVVTENRTVPGRDGSVPIRIYRYPGNALPGPTVAYFHGGGWVVGGLDECDGVCSHLSRYGNATVVSVDYRLAPENPFPSAVDDCVDAVRWIADNIDALGGNVGQICVAGDSSGGNLAAVTCQEARDAGFPKIARQILIYPCLAPRDHIKHPSRLLYGTDECFLSESALEFMTSLYVRSTEDESDSRLWPSLCDDLTKLPRAYIITAEFDMLRDEAREYSEALSNAGVSVDYRQYDGTIHGFFCFAGAIKPGQRALDEICKSLRGW